jgi:hypothetical protein
MQFHRMSGPSREARSLSLEPASAVANDSRGNRPASLPRQTNCPCLGNRSRPHSFFHLFRFKSHIHLLFAYNVSMREPDAHLPRINKEMIYLGACLIAGISPAKEIR